jgi:carbamoyl-phosphate synthase large subunit
MSWGERVAGRILITGAGSGESNNLIRSLQTGDPTLFIVGCHADRFVLKKSSADRNYLVPPSSHPHFPDVLRHIIGREEITLLIPNNDADVKAVSQLRDELPCSLFLPSKRTIELCQDKYELAIFLRGQGVPAPLTYPVTSYDSIDELFRQFRPRSPLWCRIRTGTGSTGAVPVRNPSQARSWIRYWEKMRGVPPPAFTLSEYLPGRDFACQSLWKDGKLILIKTCERLSYYGGWNRASGVSSTPQLAKTVRDSRVVRVCTDAIQAIDPAASGVFSIDLKEDVSGIPCVTEINVGRFFMITNIFDLTGKHNMAVTYVRLALDEPVNIGEAYDVAEDYYLVRDLDTLPGIFHAEELFEGVAEVEGEP